MKVSNFKQHPQNQQKQVEQVEHNIRHARKRSQHSSSPSSSLGSTKLNSDVSMGEESIREVSSSFTEERTTKSESSVANSGVSQHLFKQKDKITPIKEKDQHSSYAKPTMSSRFKSVKKSVNRLAKYRPTQEVPGFKRSAYGKTYRLSMDPGLIKSFQALSKASLNNAAAIYREAKKDLILNSSPSGEKNIQTINKESVKVLREQTSVLANKESNNTSQSDPNEPNQQANIINQKKSGHWTTDVPPYTLGSSEKVSPNEIHKKKFKHSTPPLQTSEEEEVNIMSSPSSDTEKTTQDTEEDCLPDLNSPKNAPNKRVLRSNSRQLES